MEIRNFNYSTDNNVPQESELPNDMQEPDLLVSIMVGAPELVRMLKKKESGEHCMKLKDVVFSKITHEIEIYEAHDDDGMLIARLELLSDIPRDFLLDVLASMCSDIPVR